MDLLSQWLQDEVGMKIVGTLESRFASGYAFGELLSKFNLQNDFVHFEDSDSPDAMINNFTRLQLTFSKLKIKLDSSSASAIMSGEKGVAARFVYDIKVAMDTFRKELSAGNNTYSHSNFGVETKPSLALLETKANSDRVNYTNKMHEIFEHNVRRRVPDPGTIREAVHLHKFSAERARQERKVAETKHQTQRELDFKRKTFREDLLSKMSLRKQRGKDLEDSIIQSHTASMTHRRQLEKQELAIESALSRKREGFKLLANKTAGVEARDGIDDFENTLKKLGIGEQKQDSALEPLNTSAEEHIVKIKSMVPDKSFWNTTKDDYMNTVKARVSEESAARKEREKKRKKLLLERQQAHVEAAQVRRNTMVISALTGKSNEEQRVQDRLSQLDKENQSMRDNRRNLDMQHEERDSQDLDLTLKREAEMQKKRLDQYRRETEEGEIRWTSLKEKALKEKKVRRETFARSITNQLVELAEKMIKYREITNAKVPKSEYMNWVAMITSGMASQKSDSTSSEKDKEPDEIKRALDMSSVQNYLNNNGEWDVGITCECNEELVKIISELSKEEDSPLEHTFGHMDSDCDLKVAVVGGFASGKSTLAAKLATAFNLHVIDVDKLVDNAVTVCSAPPAEDGEGSPQDEKLVQLSREIKSILNQGKDIEDEYIVKLILLEISKIKELARESEKGLQGFVLDGFPSSKDQAALLEKYMTGLDLEKVKARKENASKIAPPLESKTANIDGTLVSGLDAVFRLNMDDESLALKRVLGKRVDPETQQVYHLEFNPPPIDDAGLVERLEEVQNSITDLSIIEARLNHFAEGKGALDGWLRMFSNLLHPIEAAEGIESIQTTAGETLSNIFEEKKRAKEAIVALESATNAEEAAKAAMEAAIQARSACEQAAQQLLLAKKAEIEASSMLEANPEETDAKDVLSQKSAELCQTHFESVQKAAQESQKFAEEAQKAAESAKESADTCKSKTENISLSTSARIEAQQSATSAEEASKSAAELAEKAQLELKAAEEATKKASKTLSSEEPEESPEEDEANETTEGEQAESGADTEVVSTEISQEAKSNLWKRWQCMEKMYISGLLQVFSKLRDHRYSVLNNFVDVRESFLGFLNTPDKKQEIVTEFQKKFNSIDDDLRRRREAKAELLLRSDELCDTLWDICDKRKKEWMEEVGEIESDSFVDDHSGLLLAMFQAVCQLEMDRLAVTCSIIRDHHNAKSNLSHEEHAEIDVPYITTVEELPEQYRTAKPADPEWFAEAESLPGFQASLAANVAFVTYMTKTSLAEDSPDELKEALAKEHHDALKRLHRVVTAASKYKTDLDTISSNIFALLKEWLNARYVGSCSAVSALGDTIRQAAKAGEKLLYSIKIEADQLIIDENVLVNKCREAPKSSLDTHKGDFKQLSFRQLQILSIAMKRIAHADMVRISDAIEVLIRFTGEHLEGYKGIDSLKIHNVLRTFDVESTNHISCSHFLSCLLITSVPHVMTSKEREIMRAMREYGNVKPESGLITRDDFAAIKLWWEEREGVREEEKRIKMLWFDLFANDEGKASFQKILTAMCTDHTVESVLTKITQVYSKYGTGPDGELIASKVLGVSDMYNVAYPETPEPLQILDAKTFSEAQVSSKLTECMEEGSEATVDVGKALSLDASAFLGKLLQRYMYKDFFSLLRL
ncbi:hypothetical protein A3770_10p58570 [Chloropicon primus]|uniref:adenylate kinase n=1 Tax=Chloropicon primus TaxID=1764295 RepID=A0A5B8MRW7_9CHLO|nr:hypothetical protein A3770_10p58570 [Chloropicon primus]|eukprot:QDZ23339.1 hypothetical protein A3770_10p58570 [Chloropicon primus]